MLIKFFTVANIFTPDPVIWMINWQPAGRLGEAWNKLTAVDVICYSRGKLWAPSEKFNTQGLFWQAKELDPTTKPVQGVKLRTTIKIPQRAILEVVAHHLTNTSSSNLFLPPDSLLKSWARNIEFLHARRRQILGPRREQSGEMRWEPLWQGCPQPSHRQFMPPMTSMVTHPTSRAPPIHMLDFLSVLSVSVSWLQFVDPSCTTPKPFYTVLNRNDDHKIPCHITFSLPYCSPHVVRGEDPACW